MEKKLYRYTYIEYVNGQKAKEKRCDLRYGFPPQKSYDRLVETEDFDEFYERTFLPHFDSLFTHKPAVYSYLLEKKFTPRNFKRYICEYYITKYSLSDFDLKELMGELPADEYFDLWNDMTAKN